jgi:hypothetical protein
VSDGPGPLASAGEGSKRGGATKPPTPRLAAVEAAEQAMELIVWGWGS